MPTSRLDDVYVYVWNPHYDEEQVINGVAIVVNRGSASSKRRDCREHFLRFGIKQKVNILAEQLTGVKMYVEALRAQSHEFMNKLRRDFRNGADELL